jgi:hypothetical protein
MESNYFTNIISVRDKAADTNIPLDTCSIQKVTSMYSNTKTPIYKLVIGTKAISRNNTYLVRYKCLTCETEQEITLNLYMRKINKQKSRCDACKNSEEDKCKKQSQFMKDNINKIIGGDYIKEKVKVKSISLKDHLEKSTNDWADEDDEFKEHYTLYHLTDDDFTRIYPKIVSIGNDKITSLSEWNYFSHYRIYNQSKYTPMLIHKAENLIEKPLYIKFKCDNCECMFVHRDLEIVKNKYRILCQACSLTNKTFQLRKKTLKDGSTIMWQSIPERRFIEWCEEHKIAIKNGPVIDYEFQDKKHKYRVDFELPDMKFLIEIKDNHCWHKEQVKTGKFGEKQRCAEKWCEDNKYSFHLIFPHTLQKLKDSILKSL